MVLICTSIGLIQNPFTSCNQITMKPNDLVANAEISIHAPVTKVWHALTNPALIKKIYV